MKFRVLYFASLRDMAKRDVEEVDFDGADAASLYQSLKERHGFRLETASLRIAVNGAFAGWDYALHDGDEIAFLPPVSGG
jgi:sulfur-carrier protein